MDLKIKNVDPKDIYVIDKEIEQINKKNHTKISRSKFLRDLIKKYSEQKIKNKLNNISNGENFNFRNLDRE